MFQMATGALVDEILVPKDVRIPSPGTCINGNLYGKRDFVDVTKLRILRWGVYPGGRNVIIRIPVKKRQENQSRAGVGFDHRSRGQSDAGQRAKECGQPIEAGKARG